MNSTLTLPTPEPGNNSDQETNTHENHRAGTSWAATTGAEEDIIERLGLLVVVYAAPCFRQARPKRLNIRIVVCGDVCRLANGRP
jgi:hypothetical protein